MLTEPVLPGLRDRLLLLRRVNTFGRLSDNAMLLLAEHARVRRYQPDELVLREGDGLEHVHILGAGRIEVTAHGQHVASVGTGGAVGIVSLLARDAHGVTAVAVEPTHTLEIPLDVISNIFEESYSFLRTALRVGSGSILGRDGHRFLSTGRDTPRSPPPAKPGTTPAIGGGDPRDPGVSALVPPSVIERVIELSQHGLFSSWNVNAVFDIAKTVDTARVAAGQPLWRKGDPPAAAYHVLSGEIACAEDCDAGLARPAAMIGLLEALSETPRLHTAVARRDCVLLRIQLDDLLSALETHRDLALELLSTISKKLLPAPPG